MPPSLVHYPFEPGLTDSADPVITNGRLYQAENVRFHKQARISKRPGLTSPVYSGATGTPNAIGAWQGTPFILSNEKLLFFPTEDGGHYIQHPGSVSSVLPRRSDVIAGNQQNTTDALARADVCALPGVFVYVYDYVTDWSVSVRTHDNVILYQKARTAGSRVRALSWTETSAYTGHPTARLIWSNAGSLFITTLIGVAPYDLGNVVHSTMVSDGAFDAVATTTSGEEWYLVYQVNSTQLSVRRFLGPALQDSFAFTVGGICQSVAINVGDYGVFVVYVLNKFARGISFQTNLSSIVATGTLGSDYNYHLAGAQPAIYPKSSTDAVVLLEGLDLTPGKTARIIEPLQVAVATIQARALDNSRNFYHLALASQPFRMGNQWCTWFATDNDIALGSMTSGSNPTGMVSGWTAQRTHWMLDVSNIVATPEVPKAVLPLVMTTHPQQASVPVPTGRRGILPKAVQSLGPAVSGAPFWTCPLVEPLRKRESLTASGTTGDLTQLRSVSWVNANDGNASQKVLNKRRDWAEVHGDLQFAGGFIAEHSGVLAENNFTNYPVITRVRRGTGLGGALATGTWSFSSTYETSDPLGRRVRSNPSDPVTIMVGLGDGAIVDVATPFGGRATSPITPDPGDVAIHIYRTELNGQTYFRTTTNISPVSVPTSTTPTVSYTDTRTDASLLEQEFLYTQGGVLGNLVPPAARYMTTGGGRRWLAGLLKPRRVVMSKLIVEGEPVQFPDDPSFTIDVQEDITGIKWGDGALIVFCENSIYLVNGDGPNDQGQGSFGTAQRVPSDVGCIEHHSIVEHQDGWMFQSKRGIYLLPRGFGPPVFVGSEIQDTLLSYPIVRSAAVIADPGGVRLGETTVRYICSDANGNTRVPVWDTALKRWVSVDKYETNDLALIGVHDDKCVVVRDSMGDPNPVRRELSTAWGDGGVGTGFVSSRIKTGNIRPFGLLGWGHVKRLHVIGEVREPVTLHARVSYDGATGVMLPEKKKLGDIGARFQQQYALEKTQCNSIDVELWDGASGASEGLVFHGITLEVDPIEGLPRLGAEDRA